jgi:hypothetical protein
MFDVLAKEQCLVIYHCLALREKQEELKLLVNCAECSGQEIRHSPIKDLSKQPTFYLQGDNVLPSCPCPCLRSEPCYTALIN